MGRRPLENPEANPCFGCGPGHDRGFQLAFEEDEDEEGPFVSTRYTPGDDEVGWPGFLHGGLHFTLLYETSYWAALTLGPGLMTARSELVFEEVTVPRTGRAIETTGRIVKRPETGRYRVVAESHGLDGRRLGRLAGWWAPVDPDRIKEAGIELPGYLWDAIEG